MVQKKNNTLDSDLSNILAEANKITINDLEYNTMFKEQSQILCDIKNLLNNEKTCISTVEKCNTNSAKSNTQFHNLLNTYRDKYSKSATPEIADKPKPIDKLKPKPKPKQSTTQKTQQPLARTIKRKKIAATQSNNDKDNDKDNGKDNGKCTGTVNNNYPIVLLKNKKPYKNVILVDNK